MKLCTARVIASTLVVALWSSSLLAAPTFFEGTGHYYEYVSTPVHWDTALGIAGQQSHLGLPGYLANIQSIEENAFLQTLSNDGRIWIGGTDRNVEGTWRWADGPEKDVVFWQGNGSGASPTYANWFVPQEPNDYTGNEDAASFDGQSGIWNDLEIGGFLRHGYFVEYSFLPQPSIEFPVTPTKTYLDKEDPIDSPSPPVVIDLATTATHGIFPGAWLHLQRFGEFDFALEGDTGGPYGDGTLRQLWGVFSNGPGLSPVPVLAGDAASLESPPINDIAYDFIIDDGTDDLFDAEGVLVQVPEDATHLFVGAGDVFWSDNRLTDLEEFGFRITLVDPDSVNLDTPGDANGDGKVDGVDYVVWADSYGDNPADDPPGSPENGDFNDDGVVDGIDYLVWASNFGQGPNDGVAVPEPSTLSIALLGLVCLFETSLRRRNI